MSARALDQGARTAVWPDGWNRPVIPFSPAIKAGGWLFASAQMATDLVSGLAPEARLNSRNPNVQDAVELQSWALMKNLDTLLQAGGCDISRDSVRIQQWRVAAHPTMQEFEQGSTWTGLSVSPYYRARNHYIAEPRPASTGMGVRALPLRDGLIAVDMIAIEPQGSEAKRGIGVPDGVPAPLAGYSPAIVHGDWVFLAGEIATDWQGDFMSERQMGPLGAIAPEARVNPYFWYGSPIETQTEYVLKKMDLIAKAAGSSLSRCVKANVYIGTPSDYYGMDRVWKQWFPKDPPARVVLPYMGLSGMGCRIEIDMILLSSDSKIARRTISSMSALEPIGHEPQAVVAGNFIFFSTQLAANRSGAVPEAVGNPEFPYFTQTAKLQVRRIIESMASICDEAGTSISNLCQVKEFYEDLHDFAPVREEIAHHFGDAPPASTSVEVGAPLIVPGCRLLLDAIGYVPSPQTA